ncbi:MAG: GntR family transcriptional regulator [Ramlibacter sp.]|nr:GntR family transcriptional regulator [Ramlibacter sp.]
MSPPPVSHGLQALASGPFGPLYRQAKRELQRVVESGRYGPGATLPNESVIAAALGVSIGTVRKAVDELVHEHVLVRRQGKGTYVALHNDDRFLFQFFHVEPRDEFTEAQERPVREYPQVQCMGFVRGRADEAEAAALRIKPGDPVARIANRLSLAGRPVVHDRLAVAAQTFRGLNEKRFLERPSTIYGLYQSDHGITVLRARERARAAAASPETARILGVPVGLPVLEVHRIALTFGDKPVEYRISTINTAMHDYVSILSKQR